MDHNNFPVPYRNLTEVFSSLRLKNLNNDWPKKIEKKIASQKMLKLVMLKSWKTFHYI